MEYLDVFVKEEDRLLLNTVRKFVEKEIFPVRQQIDEDKETFGNVRVDTLKEIENVL